MAQRLKVFQSLWAMEQRVPGAPEDPPELWLDRIADAGFDGVCVDPAFDEIEATLTLQPLIEARGLGVMVNAFPATLEEMKPLLEMAKAMNAVFVNAIGQVMPLTVEEGVEVVERWRSDAVEVGVDLLFETHRDCTLNDLHYTLQLLDRLPDLRLCADLSHYVIDREMRLPLGAQDAASMIRILSHSDCFQGRVSNGEQVQVPLDFPQHAAWVSQFQTWWAEGLRGWRARSAPDAELVFLCELGPPPSAITDAEQRELSDRWAEALTIRDWVMEAWEDCEPDDAQTGRVPDAVP
ncbi:MAG: sugar phosphate isomerase/epimerase [Pseudomonadota bacterium]